MAAPTQPNPTSAQLSSQADDGVPSSMDEEYLDELRPEPSFWQEPWVQNALPIVTSLVIHGALILLGLLTFKAYQAAVTVSQEQVIIPDAAIMTGDVGGVPNPGLEGDPNLAAASDLVPENTQSEGWNRQPSKSLQANVLGGSGDTEANTVIGIGAAGTLGKGKGTGVGSGDGEGASAPFGVPGGGRGQGPKFMGLGTGGGNVRTIAYVCDASGSMMGLPFDLLKIELKKAVDMLAPIQAFNIIFFQEGKAGVLSQQLIMANPNNKQKAYQYLQELTVKSNSDPIPSIKKAFEQKPQLVYLLTDGAFEDNDAVINELRKLNASKGTRINTIAFFSPDAPPSDRKVCEDVLRKIASENGGMFKVVLTTDLMK
jgi:hypothetical protein